MSFMNTSPEDTQTGNTSIERARHQVVRAKRPCVLVVHASVGSGHRSAAHAIAEAFEALQAEGDPCIPPGAEVRVIDILDYGRIGFDGNKLATWFTGATRPIYDLTWRFTLTGRLLWAGGYSWAAIMFPRFTKLVQDAEPLAIICTHITAANAAVGARMISGLSFPVVCVPTDYDIEGWWPHLDSDLFCVASEYMKETLRPRRLPAERVVITGIPTREAFRADYDSWATRVRLGLPQDKTLALVLAGAYSPVPYALFREAIDRVIPALSTMPSLHMVFVCGKDVEYEDHIRKQVEEYGLTNVTILSYVEDMAELMYAADLAICKAGGLTVTECLCARTPMILVGRAYGQEKSNVQMLTNTGSAMHVSTPHELLGILRVIVDHPESMQAMLINARHLRRPDAARNIVKVSMRLSEKIREGEVAQTSKHFARFYLGSKPAHIR